MKTISLTLMAVLLGLEMARGATPQLSAGAGEGVPGGTTSLPGTLATTTGGVALQYDVLFNGGMLEATAVTPANALLSHNLDFHQVANGTSRVLVYSLSNSALTNGVLANLYFAIASNAPVGTVAITLTNGIVADGTGKAIGPLSYVPGSLTVRTGPARLGEIVRSSDGVVRFDVTGGQAGAYQIEASTDLVQWEIIGSGTAAAGLIEVVDSDARFLEKRFYRALPRP